MPSALRKSGGLPPPSSKASTMRPCSTCAFAICPSGSKERCWHGAWRASERELQSTASPPCRMPGSRRSSSRRRRAGLRHPLLPRAPAADAARAHADAGGRGGGRGGIAGASFATRPATAWTRPTPSIAARATASCSATARRLSESYTPKPDSRDYVINLAGWYAQATRSRTSPRPSPSGSTRMRDWRAAYRGWPALRKLEYVDELMREIAGKPLRQGRPDRGRAAVDAEAHPARALQRKRAYFAWIWPANYDGDLRRIFSEAPRGRQGAAGDPLPAAQAARSCAPALPRAPASMPMPSINCCGK